MVFIYSLLFFFITSLCAEPLKVRVLLDDHITPSWTFKSSRGFKLCTNEGKEIQLGITYHKLSIVHNEGALLVNNKQLKQKELWFVPYQGPIHFAGNCYEGRLGLVWNGNRWLLMNEVDSEEYTYSVLGSEGWPGWPLGFFKALAVAVRSYLLYQMDEAKKLKRPYHIKNSNYHQTYAGIHQCKIIRQAVDETENLVLLHKNKPILAMFDSCCGGVVPRYVRGFIDFNKVPYLARSYACQFCKKSKFFVWRKEYSLQDFALTLQNHSDDIIHKIKDVHIIKKDKAGVPHKVLVRTSKAEHFFSGKDLYRLKDIKSFAFTIHKRGSRIIVKGNGYGHHMGLCQQGAYEMISRGYSYKKVLTFYYPGTELTHYSP